MLQQKSISVVVACYADGGNVREMHRRLTAILPALTPDYEIIFVNDASPDNAEELLVEIAAADPRVTVISHTRNFGSQMAFTSGLRQSIGDGVVLMDGDLQDPPEAIPALVAQWTQGYDVVYGVRTRRAESFPMQIARKLFYRLYRRLLHRRASGRRRLLHHEPPRRRLGPAAARARPFPAWPAQLGRLPPDRSRIRPRPALRR
jgi:dolichol-phosphate mannosyltransferase